MALWTAFIFGLAGSIHCLGMCGPLALALPLREGRRQVLGRVLYNTGRVSSYIVLGGLIGFVGQGLARYQQQIAISCGVMILLGLIAPRLMRRWKQLLPTGKLSQWFRARWQMLFKQTGLHHLFMLGIMNGFLPCGLVYLALAGALTQPSSQDGAIYMAGFGFGTWPMMLSLSLAPTWLKPKQRIKLQRLMPFATALMGVLFILRGLSLGIPYLSPVITTTPTQDVKTMIDCCHSIGE